MKHVVSRPRPDDEARQVEVLPAKTVQIRRVTLADFKQRAVNWRQMRKGVLLGDSLFVEARTSLE